MLVTIASGQQQPRRVLMDEWIIRGVYVTYCGILFSLKRREVLSNAIPWTSLEDMMLSEINQLQKDHWVCMYVHEVPGVTPFRETK